MGHHLHHLVGSLAMVYMAVAMAPGAAHATGGGHAGHGAGAAGPAGGVPLVTGALLVYYALYVLHAAGRLIPVPAPVGVPAERQWGSEHSRGRPWRNGGSGLGCAPGAGPGVQTDDGHRHVRHASHPVRRSAPLPVSYVTWRARPYPWIPRPS